MKKLRNNGFTLAEVLITLSIIGVIAAMTIPSLVQKQQEKATVAALRKTFSTLSNAYTLAVQKNGTPDTWGLTAGASPSILGNFIPYLKIDKNCPSGDSGCWPPGVDYRWLNGSFSNQIFDNSGYPKLKLLDGTLLMGYVTDSDCKTSRGESITLKNICGYYYIDTNGYKQPNQYGKDLFHFYLTKYGIIPSGTAQSTTQTFSTCKDGANGTGCAAWVLYNENLDYLHCSDLSWDGKKKCD